MALSGTHKPDKYSAVWVSHSSMGDFLKCPRCYYLHNVYKDPKNRRKINIVSPAMSLGVAVHEVVEGLADIKAEERFASGGDGDPASRFLYSFDQAWKKVSGKKGGFRTLEEEQDAKARGQEMIRRVANHPGLLAKKAVRLKDGHNGMPPNFFLSEEENIILCGKIDWLVYDATLDSVEVLDFKTGKNEEKENSLQLPIYQLLLHRLQKRKVTGAWYWYLDRDDEPLPVSLPTAEESFDRVIVAARAVKKARDESALFGPDKAFLCPQGSGGCFACKPFEKILRGEAEYLGVGEYNQDLYMI